MGILKKDVNLQLLFLIMIIGVLFAVFSVHYQYKITTLSSEYEKKLEEFGAITAQLVIERENAEKFSNLKDLAQTDVRSLEKSCYDLKNEVDDLKIEKRRLRERLDFSSINDKVFKKNICETTGNAKCL